MAYFVWKEGADPDPWSIFPYNNTPAPNCGQEIRDRPRDFSWTCTRAKHSDGPHVARLGNGQLCAYWDPEDEDRDTPDAYLDPSGKPVVPKAACLTTDQVRQAKPGTPMYVLPPGDGCPTAVKKLGLIPGMELRFEKKTSDCCCGCGGWLLQMRSLDQPVCRKSLTLTKPVVEAGVAAAMVAEKSSDNKETASMAKPTKVEKAEIVYSEKVTFRVDDAKEIVIDNEAEAIKWLQNRMEEREKEISFTEVLSGSYPTDGMIALARVLRREYGFTKFDSPNPFGTPHVFSIPVDARGTTHDAPWGKFSIPGLAGFLMTSIAMDKTNQPVFQLAAKIKNKDKDKVRRLAALVREDLLRNSIYRGKAIRVEFPDFRKTAFDPAVHIPAFMDVTKADPGKLVFSREVANAVETSIFTPIEYSAAVKKHIGTLKRGVLLGGKPGTGKTLAAFVTARKCEENGWTFIYLSSTGDLAQAIGFAKMYQPAVIFAEDLDSIVNTYAEDGDRDEATTAILNTLDGIDSKNNDVMVVFTTNYPEKLPEAMTRPGRLDAIITVLPPDTEAVEKLIRLYANGLMDPTENLARVSGALAGQIPAVIKEVVDRSKLVAIRHTREGCVLRITAEDLVVAKDSMVSHLRMLNEKRQMPPSDIEKAANVVVTHVVAAMKKASEQGGDGFEDEAGVLPNPPDKDARLVKTVQNGLPFPDGRQ